MDKKNILVLVCCECLCFIFSPQKSNLHLFSSSVTVDLHFDPDGKGRASTRNDAETFHQHASMCFNARNIKHNQSLDLPRPASATAIREMRKDASVTHLRHHEYICI